MSDNKVMLGLSGGVDSAVSAYLLKKQGYDVTCCFMRNWDSIMNNDIQGNPTLAGDKCSQEFDYDDAVETAFELDLPILRKDFIKEYWDDVFSQFLKTYERGFTPIQMSFATNISSSARSMTLQRLWALTPSPWVTMP